MASSERRFRETDNKGFPVLTVNLNLTGRFGTPGSTGPNGVTNNANHLEKSFYCRKSNITHRLSKARLYGEVSKIVRI